jgi:DMSO/TMAO reductase YedYZ molybdopterin-dependent catalytic subunit
VPRAGTASRTLRPAVLLLAVLALAGPAAAQDAAAARPADGASAPAAVVLSGGIKDPRTLALADLQALPAITVEVTVAAAQGPRRITYTGALLWPLLQAAAPVDAPGHATQHQHVLMARGSDGYAVAVAFGEMDPHLEGKQVLIAYAMDGHPLPAPRLVVPGDSHGARAVHDLSAIEVR